MSCSPVLKWSVVLLLTLTVAWKAAIRPDDSTDLKNRIVEFLSQHRFDVTVADEIMEDMPIIRATRDDCSMLVMKASPRGWDRDVIHQLAGESAGVFVIFRGDVYAQQPTRLTMASYIWSNLLRELGLRRHAIPVIAVAAQANCNAESLPWNDLRNSGII